MERRCTIPAMTRRIARQVSNRGLVAAGSQATVSAGRAMLEAGGNAVDAAVAAAFASFISEIGLVHWGGSGLALIHDERSGRSLAYDFLSAMPGRDGLRPQAERDFEGVSVDFGSTTQDFFLGRASVAVPGAILGLCRMARDHGRLSLSQLLAPAIRLAREGAMLDAFQADTCALLAPLYLHTPGMRRIFLRSGRMIRAGERLFIPDLARSLERLAASGERELLEGALGKALLEDQAAEGGLLTAGDLKAYRVCVSRPLRVRYRGFDLLLPPLPAVGGLLTAFSLVLASHAPAARPGSAAALRRFYEVMRLTDEARSRIEAMLEIEDAAAVSQAVLRSDFLGPYVQRLALRLAGRGPGRDGQAPAAGPTGSQLGNTTHLSVMDAEGMAVALTTTAGESAGYVVPGTGLIPNNMLGEADLNPRGWHAWPPGDRIPSMMTPLLGLERGRIRLATGSGGSERIRSAVLQVVDAYLAAGMPLSEAVAQPRVHLERGVLQCEGGYEESEVAALEGLGYPVNRWPGSSIYFGGAHSVARGIDGGGQAAGDPRRAGRTAVIV